MQAKGTILIVDDDPAIRAMLAMNLKDSYDVLVAHDGLNAVQIYEHNAGRIVAIVTDLEMPRLSGALLAEWVHHISPQLPVILMSGNVRKVDLEELLRGPAVTFLPKPFKSAQLLALLGSILGEEPGRVSRKNIPEGKRP
jgi:CheY-like chemotaxis protein